jgi:hypothetical protein
MYMIGKAITAAEMTVACHEKMIEVLRRESNPLSGPCLPKNRSRPSPTTVGGRTRGRINIPSIKLASLPEYRAIHRAAAIPKMNVIAVAAATVRREIQSGDR